MKNANSGMFCTDGKGDTTYLDRRSHWSRSLVSFAKRVPVVFSTMVALVPCISAAQGYIDVAPAVGLDFLVASVPGSFVSDFGSGVSFYDIDKDGWDDLTFADNDDSLHFFKNVEGDLVRMPSVLFGEGRVKQILWADIDNDGDSDLFTSSYDGPLKLMRNDGDLTFTDITSSSGLSQSNAQYYGASFGDFNRDGFLDLYVCNYIHFPLDPDYRWLNKLYQNNGDGTFADVTLLAGVGNGQLASFQSVWMDFDLDGWPDLYVINDFNPTNALYRNNGDGTFSDMAESFGLGLPFENPMSISLSDFDIDGDLDLFVTNTGIYPEVNSARSLLMQNNGDGSYTEVSESLGLNVFEWGWGGLWVDHNNDGYQDLFVATQRDFGSAVPNQFHVNNGGLSFTDGASLFSSSLNTKCHSVARGDLDRDGYADIAVQSQAPYPPYLWKNEGGEAHFVRVTVEGTVSNRQGIGTWIRIHAGGQYYVHYTVCGENYLGQSSQHILFGLADATVIDSVEVEYLSGHVDRYYDLEVDQEYLFAEGETYAVSVTADGPLAVCAPDSVVLDAGEHAYYLWSTGDTVRTIVVQESGIYTVTAGEIPGLAATTAPIVVTISAPPVIVAAATDPICAGDSTGSIVLTNLVGTELSSVLWEPTAEGESLAGLPAGVYTYTAVDVNGCSFSGLVELIDPDPLFVLVNATPEAAGNDGAIIWTIFGGVPPYMVQLNGDTVAGDGVEGLTGGLYQLLVTDSQGCELLNEVEVPSTVGIASVQEGPELLVYPNPAAHLLYLDTPERIVAWTVLDNMGRIVLRGKGAEHFRSVDVRSLSAGAYVLKVNTGQGEHLRARFQKVPATALRY